MSQQQGAIPGMRSEDGFAQPSVLWHLGMVNGGAAIGTATVHLGLSSFPWQFYVVVWTVVSAILVAGYHRVRDS